MRPAILLFLLTALVACGSESQEDTYYSAQQEYNSDPPPRLPCDYPLAACGGLRCSNLQWDNNNCGVCDNECDRSSGEICHNFQCKSIEVFGFDNDVLKRGPVEYNPKKDLPRPLPIGVNRND